MCAQHLLGSPSDQPVGPTVRSGLLLHTVSSEPWPNSHSAPRSSITPPPIGRFGVLRSCRREMSCLTSCQPRHFKMAGEVLVQRSGRQIRCLSRGSMIESSQAIRFHRGRRRSEFRALRSARPSPAHGLRRCHLRAPSSAPWRPAIPSSPDRD
jgi:hypothetical protein